MAAFFMQFIISIISNILAYILCQYSTNKLTMKKALLSLALLLSCSLFAQVEMRYAQSTDNNPRWIQLMYADNQDAGLITKAYQDYYKTHPFVKNKHTQYYKRWQRSLSRAKAKPHTKIHTSYKKQLNPLPHGFLEGLSISTSMPLVDRTLLEQHIYTVWNKRSAIQILFMQVLQLQGFGVLTDKGDNWYCLSKSLPISAVYSVGNRSK